MWWGRQPPLGAAYLLTLAGCLGQLARAETGHQLLDTFQKLFVAKRMEQLQAVKSIVTMGKWTININYESTGNTPILYPVFGRIGIRIRQARTYTVIEKTE